MLCKNNIVSEFLESYRKKTIENVDNLIIMLFCFITGLLQDNIHFEDQIKCYICIINFVRT